MTNHAKKRIFVILLMALAGIAIVVFSLPKSSVDNQDVDSVEPGLDEQYRQLVVGTWEDDYKGRRRLTVRADGTATMVVEPEGINAILATRLTFEEEWSIADGHIKQTAIGGEPKSRVNLILKTMGTESNQKILELTDTRMLLLDPDGETQYDWRRIE